MSGYVRSCFAGRTPLSLSASIAREQSYASVETDSASSAELCALLSALADLPLRQDIAIAGSVNQKGEAQAVDGVNERIEGFYDTCQRRGLTGRQGVVIPRSNLGSLMLREDVVKAVEQGAFHLYAIERVEEALEILSGVASGERQADGDYPEGSAYARVQARLRDMTHRLRQARTANNAERPSTV